MKPENILINDCQSQDKEGGVGSLFNSALYDIKIADFGYSQSLKKQSDKSNTRNRRRTSSWFSEASKKWVCGTPCFIAPECLRGYGTSLKSDIYSIGALLFTLITHKRLFGGDTKLEILSFNKISDVSHVPEYLSMKLAGLKLNPSSY